MRITKHIFRQSLVVPSVRVAQMSGLFDVEPASLSAQHWNVDWDLPDRWNIGVIVGPSGCGKSTIARECFGQYLAGPFGWRNDHSLLDDFPGELGIREIVGLLSSVGFSSPPAWVRSFDVLSTGQQFRVNLARALAEAMIDHQPKLVDEYSSVVDRTVARIGSAAVAKTVRRHRLQLIAVTCHYDVLDWLEPDWVYEPISGQVRAHGSVGVSELQDSRASSTPTSPNAPTPTQSATPSREGLRRPPIELEILRTDSSAWKLFKPHHYLSANLHKSSACYVALIENQPAAFTAVLPFPHPTRSGWREHRTVCLPDFQGVGIGNAMSEFVASLYHATGKPYTSTTSHPAMIRHRARSLLWRMTRAPSLVGGHAGQGSMRKTGARTRLTAGFRYVGPPRPREARQFGII